MPDRIEQTEKQFSDVVVEYARLCGWLVHRDPTWRATGADPGYPDLTLVRFGQIIFAELKLDAGKLTAAQKEWQEAIGGGEANDVYATVWRPRNWPEIEKVLR